SLYMTRVMFRFWEMQGWLRKLSMARLLSRTRINFMGIRKPVFVATVVTALLGVVIFLARGSSSLNMDFVGGTVMTVETRKPLAMDEVRKKLEDPDRHAKWLAVESVEPVADEENTFNVIYKEKVAGTNERKIHMPERVSVEEMRRRAETLPEVAP